MAATHSHASAHAPTHDFPPHSGASNAPRQPSQRIGDFEVIRTLGTGSFGKVKRVFPLPQRIVYLYLFMLKYVQSQSMLLPDTRWQ